jgi:dolichol-phosphate mannosyltransferase
VIPVHNESGNVELLVSGIAEALDGRAYEMILVDDCSTDNTREILVGLKSKYPTLRVLGHRKNSGQSRAIRTGVLHATAPIVATLDGDGQNPPVDLPELYRALTRTDAASNLGLVQGVRQKRQDSGWKKFGSKLANRIRKKILNDDHTDSGCGAKAFKRDAFLMLPYFDHMHRYMPALMKAEGFAVEAIPVSHKHREFGVSKYTNFGRLAAAITDLRGVLWLRSRRRLPEGVDEL